MSAKAVDDPGRFAADVRAAIQETRQRVDAFIALPQQTPAPVALRTLDRVLAPLNGCAGRVHLYRMTHPDASVRQACDELEQEIAALRTEMSLHRGLYDRVVAIDSDGLADEEQRRLLRHTLRDFRRGGVDREPEIRERIRALQEELVLVGQEFDRNIATGGRAYVVPGGQAGLRGLPQDYLDAHPPDANGEVTLTTDPNDSLPLMCYAEDGEVRRGYYLTVNNRAFPENLEVLSRLLAKRHELARMLGYAHWADYVTEDKMTGSAAEARAFIERVVGIVRPLAQAEYDTLLSVLREVEPGAQAVSEADRLFLVEKLKERSGFDSKSVRPYFSYERVKQGVLDTSGRLYGVEFRRDADAPVWHESVEVYEVFEEGRLLARIFLDMHPRDDKFKHAAMFHLIDGVAGEGLPEACLVCNFQRPTKSDPALLEHDQVATLFHEVGHMLHHLFGGHGDWFSFSGIATEHDFVEVPSQLYEEWAWNTRVLQEFARHHETDEPLPAELIERMRQAEECGKAQHVLQQMFYATISMTCHDRDPEALDPLETIGRLKDEMLLLAPVEGNHFLASFGHLHGYSAMYYTYMWSLVIAKDVFGPFIEDPLDRDLARRYRAAILAPGGARDGRELVRDFLGRDYGFEAFQAWLTAGNA